MRTSFRAARLAPAVCVVLLASTSLAFAQPAGPAPAAAPAAAPAIVPEGTELPLRLEDKLSSKTNAVGDRFAFTLDKQVTLSNGAMIPAGCQGVGEVTQANKSGMFGKPGALNVRFDYIKVGATRIPLRGTRGSEGKGSVASVVALTALFGVAGFFVHGHNIEVMPGQIMTAYVDQDTVLPSPVLASATGS